MSTNWQNDALPTARDGLEVVIAQAPGTDPVLARSWEALLRGMEELHGGKISYFVEMGLPGQFNRKLVWRDSLDDDMEYYVSKQEVYK